MATVLPPMPPLPATSFSLLSASASMSNHVFMASNATILGYLNVEKINYRYSNVTIYDSTNITSNLDVDGTLIVGGKTTLSDKLSVNGVATLCNAVTVLGVTSLSNNLFCTGSIDTKGNITTKKLTTVVVGNTNIGGSPDNLIMTNEFGTPATWKVGVTNTDALAFSSSTGQKMRIDAGGNVALTGSIGIGVSPPTYPLRAYRAVAENVAQNTRAFTIDHRMTENGFSVMKANPYNDVAYDYDGVYGGGTNSAFDRYGNTISGFNSLLTSNASGTSPNLSSRKVNLILGKNADNSARLYYSYNADDEHFACMSVVKPLVNGPNEANRFVVGTTRSYIESGNFGIGTTAPTEKLHVDGSVFVTGAIAAQGPISGPGSVPIGVVMMWTTNSIPTGWVLCDGRSLSKTTFAGLFAVIGGIYGSGSSTFNVPNLCSRSIVGAGQGVNLTNRGIATIGGAETHTLSVAEMPSHGHILTVNANGSHTHGQSGSTGAGGDHSHTTAVGGNHSHTGGTGGASANYYSGGNLSRAPRYRPDILGDDERAGYVNCIENFSSGNHTHGLNINGAGDHGHSISQHTGHQHTIDTTPNHIHTGTADNSGGGTSHNNMQPFFVLQFIMRAM